MSVKIALRDKYYLVRCLYGPKSGLAITANYSVLADGSVKKISGSWMIVHLWTGYAVRSGSHFVDLRVCMARLVDGTDWSGLLTPETCAAWARASGSGREFAPRFNSLEMTALALRLQTTPHTLDLTRRVPDVSIVG